MDIIENLNDKQKEAVTWTEGDFSYAMLMDEISIPEELLQVYVPMIR